MNIFNRNLESIEKLGFEDLNFVLYGYGDGSFGAMLEAYAKTSSFISVAESGLGSPADLRAEKKRAAHKRRCAADPDGEAARRRVKQATSRERAAEEDASAGASRPAATRPSAQPRTPFHTYSGRRLGGRSPRHDLPRLWL